MRKIKLICVDCDIVHIINMYLTGAILWQTDSSRD